MKKEDSQRTESLRGLQYLQHHLCCLHWGTALCYRPGEKDALHHVEVLHQDVSLGFGAQVAHRVADAQLDGTFQG